MTKIVGIANFTQDSFSDGGIFNNYQEVINYINLLFNQGADYIDLGAQASGYNAKLISKEEEWDKIKSVLENINQDLINKISIDTFNTYTAEKSIRMGIKFINDISGGREPEMLNLIADNPKVKYVAMFSLKIPADQNTRVNNIEEIYKWAEKKIEELDKYNINKNQIILDPGIGFTTNSELSFKVIKNIENLKKINIPIYIGHSRKSFLNIAIDKNLNLSPRQKDIETLAISSFLYQKKVDYIRVHNVALHKRSFNIFSSI